MSYQVLARKYRPQLFKEVVGQIHVTQTLQNALDLKRIHHAYLFTGARGIGKTTVARILAKALNCLQGIQKEPCNQCETCLEVLDGKSLDVQEIDGASNTSVEDVRQIREQVKYLPAHGRYKIYIIDEVHMLSTSAFNALLKTLEEPPPHVVFIFATTEAHKIPTTILSRCQRYDFKRIPIKELADSLKELAKAEKVTVEEDALSLIVHEAQGSLRDAQSLLDQAIAYAGQNISYANLKEMFGFSDRNQLLSLLKALLNKDKQEALQQLNLFYQAGSDLNRLAQDLLGCVRNLLLMKSVEKGPSWLDIPREEVEIFSNLSQHMSLEELDQLFQLTYRGVEDIARSQTPKMVFEILMVRMTLVGKVVALNEVLEKLEHLTPRGSARTAAKEETPPQRGGDQRSEEVGAKGSQKSWQEFVVWLHKTKPQLASIIDHGAFMAMEEKLVTLAFEAGSVYGEMLQEEDRLKLLKEHFLKFFGRELGLNIVVQEVHPSSHKLDAQAQKKQLKAAALEQESIKEAANILGAIVEEVRTEFDE